MTRFLRAVGKYILNVLIGLDQLLNAILFGDPDETVSSRCAKILHLAALKGAPAPFVWHRLGWFLEWIDPGHLKRTLECDEGDDAIFWVPVYECDKVDCQTLSARAGS